MIKSKERVVIVLLLSLFLIALFLLIRDRGSESDTKEQEIPSKTVVAPEPDTESDTEEPIIPPEPLIDPDSDEIVIEEPIEIIPIENSNSWWEYPDEIYPVIKDPDDLTVLVNKKYILPSDYSPNDLANLNNISIRIIGDINVRSILLNDLNELGIASQQAGIDLSVISGYRSYNTQLSTYQYWVTYNGGNTAAADTISARPGHSQHQLGTAVDFSSSEIGDQLGSAFDNTAAALWLQQNAWKYGFVLSYPAGYESVTGYAYESWHYRYIGKENASAVVESGLILEEWLAQ